MWIKRQPAATRHSSATAPLHRESFEAAYAAKEGGREGSGAGREGGEAGEGARREGRGRKGRGREGKGGEGRGREREGGEGREGGRRTRARRDAKRECSRRKGAARVLQKGRCSSPGLRAQEAGGWRQERACGLYKLEMPLHTPRKKSAPRHQKTAGLAHSDGNMNIRQRNV